MDQAQIDAYFAAKQEPLSVSKIHVRIQKHAPLPLKKADQALQQAQAQFEADPAPIRPPPPKPLSSSVGVRQEQPPATQSTRVEMRDLLRQHRELEERRAQQA